MAERPPLILHLGVHKTATTYLQSLLAHNQKLLASKERFYWTLEQLRRPIATAISEASPGGGLKSTLRRNIAPRPSVSIDTLMDFAGVGYSIFSEENILGPTNQSLDGTLYPNAARRLSSLSPLFRDREIRLFLSLRDYADFLASLFVEALRHGHWLTPDQFMQANENPKGQWVNLVRSLCTVVPSAQITIWRYADFAAQKPQLIELLTGLKASALVEPESGDARPGATAQAVLEHCKHAEPMSRAQRIMSMAKMEYRYPISSNAKFAPWPDDARAAMAAAFEEDLDEIATLPNVRLLS